MSSHRGWIGQEEDEVGLRRELDGHLGKMLDYIDKVREGFDRWNNDSLVCAGIKVEGVKYVRYFTSRHDPNFAGDPSIRWISHAEREAIEWAKTRYPLDKLTGAILLTTLSPCTLSSDQMVDRIGCSCEKRAKQLNLRVYSAVHDAFQGERPKFSADGPSQTLDRSLIMRAAHKRKLILSPAENNEKNKF